MNNNYFLILCFLVTSLRRHHQNLACLVAEPAPPGPPIVAVPGDPGLAIFDIGRQMLNGGDDWYCPPPGVRNAESDAKLIRTYTILPA